MPLKDWTRVQLQCAWQTSAGALLVHRTFATCVLCAGLLSCYRYSHSGINNPPSLSYHYHRRAGAPAPAAAHMAQMANGSSAPRSLPATALQRCAQPQRHSNQPQPATRSAAARALATRYALHPALIPDRSTPPRPAPSAAARSAADAHTQSPYRVLLGRGPHRRARARWWSCRGRGAHGVGSAKAKFGNRMRRAPLCGCGRVGRSACTPKRKSQMHLPVVY